MKGIFNPIPTDHPPPAESDDAPAFRRSFLHRRSSPGWRWGFVLLGIVVLLTVTAVALAAATGHSWPGSPLRGRPPTLEPTAPSSSFPWFRVEPGAPALSPPDTPTPWQGSNAPGAQRPADELIAAREGLLQTLALPVPVAVTLRLPVPALTPTDMGLAPSQMPAPGSGPLRATAVTRRPAPTNTPQPEAATDPPAVRKQQQPAATHVSPPTPTHVPPGQTKTPPGLEKTPKPTHTLKPTKTPKP